MSQEWEIEFYEDENGEEPFRKWLDDLPETKRVAMIAAIERVLMKQGLNVCGSEWGKQVGESVFEFRVRHTADEIKQMFPTEAERTQREELVAGETGGKAARGEVLLRAMCHAYGNKIVLMVAGYDKGKSPGKKRQQKVIRKAQAAVRRFKIVRRRGRGSG